MKTLTTIATIAAAIALNIATANAQRHNDANRHESNRSEMRDGNRGHKGDVRSDNHRNHNGNMREEQKRHNDGHKFDGKRFGHNDGGRHGRPEKIHDYHPIPSPHAPSVGHGGHNHHAHAIYHVADHHLIHHHVHGHGPIVIREHTHYIVTPAPIFGVVPIRHNMPLGYISTKVLLNIPNISTYYDTKLSVPLPNYIKVVNEYKAFGDRNYVRDADLVLEVMQVGVDIMSNPIYALALIDLHAYDNNVVATWNIDHTFGDIRWSIERVLDQREHEIATVIKEWDYRHMNYVI